jgi:N-methylhydantoinase A
LGLIDPIVLPRAVGIDRPRPRGRVAPASALRLGMNAAAAAMGVSEIVDENMASAARMHAVESGKDLARG